MRDHHQHREQYDSEGLLTVEWVSPYRVDDSKLLEGNIATLKTIVIPVILFVLILVPVAEADEARALERLMNVISGLEELGDELLGEPVTGSMILEDTISHELTFNQDYMYLLYIWSDSYFNIIEFWMEDPSGGIYTTTDGDVATLAVFPDTTGKWILNILLHEGADSNSASYAAAVLRARRHLKPLKFECFYESIALNPSEEES